MKFVFLGPPGAGKGTLAKKVAESYNIPHISTGDIFRGAIKAQTPLGIKVKSILDSGALVDDQTTVDLVKERLSQDDAKNGFILDGFPRTIPQAEALEKIQELDCAVNFEIQDELVIKRLSGRRVCKKCGQNYHVDFLKSKQEGICDLDGGQLFIREDDKPESISHRLEVYREQTAPLIDFYRTKNLLEDIDSSPNVQQVLVAFEEKFPKAT